MARVKITDSEIKKLVKGGELRDTEISGFCVRKRLEKITFRLVYNSPVTGKRRYYTLGRYGNITAAQARDIAKKAVGQVANGVDPQHEKECLRDISNSEAQKTLRFFMNGGFKDVTPEERWKKTSKSVELHFADWLDRPMDSLEKAEAQKWLNDYKGAPAGANRLLNCVKGILTKAVDAKVSRQHPFRGVKDLPVDKRRKKSTDYS